MCALHLQVLDLGRETQDTCKKSWWVVGLSGPRATQGHHTDSQSWESRLASPSKESHDAVRFLLEVTTQLGL